MPPNPHIVGRIEESRIDTRPVADDPLQKSGIATVATSYRLRSWCCRNGRNDLVIRIGDRCENHIDLAGREAGQSRIDINIERREFAQFQLQDFQSQPALSAILLSAIRSARFWVSEPG